MTPRETASQAEMRLKLLDRVREWPTQPGIYIMRDAANRILYVGKAKNLRNRIKSYFLKVDALTGKTRLLVKKIQEVEFTVTNTELEALLLECNLIKKHRPRYNIRLKDDKNFPYVVLDFTHPFPQIRITRRVFNSPDLKYFGPFSGGVHEIGRFLLKTFQIRDCSDAKFKNRTRPCLNYEIGICTAPCVGLVTEEAYGKQLQEAILFLKGRKRELLSTLKEDMYAASEKMEYERAKTLRDKIHAVETITAKQDAVLMEQQLDIDVVGCYVGDNEVQWVVLFIRNGFLIGRRAEKTPLALDSLEETTRSFLEQFYTISLVPDEVWLSNDFPGRETVEAFMSQRADKKVQVRVRRSEKPMRLLGMAYENAKLIYQEAQKKQTVSASQLLQQALELPECPHTIEGIDVSNLQGENAAVALVHFSDERPLKSQYRIYHPKTVEGQDDFAMIYEVVTRRYSKPDPPPPDLLLIDGGKGQLASAVKALGELGIEIPVCSIAKARTERGFTRKEVERTEDRIFIPGRKNPLNLKEGNPAMALLQRVRDEAHRFSVYGHRRRRTKNTFENSPLLEVEGLGDKKRKMLLVKFGDMEAIRAASIEDLVGAGLDRPTAQRLLANFRGGEE